MGHLQRGGVPTSFDSILATRLGTGAADMIIKGAYGYTAATRGNPLVEFPLIHVARDPGRIPLDDALLHSARSAGACFGD